MKKIILIMTLVLGMSRTYGQDIIPLDTSKWDISGNYLFESFKGKQAVYLKGGAMSLKNRTFLNGTIEFDLFLKEKHMFPGIYFRVNGADGEQFFVRPHLSGKPDANQAAPLVKGVTPFQLFFGAKYSFPYTYKFDDWTHVKLVVNGDRAQVFLDGADKPNLSWHLTMPIAEGALGIRGGGLEAIHIADVRIDEGAIEMVDFEPGKREAISGIVEEWEISDMFEEKLLDDPEQLKATIEQRSWGRSIKVEEGVAANISRQQLLYNGEPGNTVFARMEIESSKKELKLFEFGYSDRVVVILNGEPIYRGTNKWRSRDYRYLGTIGLFDAVYLNLKKGKNTLLLAVSEDFGGWLVTGRLN